MTSSSFGDQDDDIDIDRILARAVDSSYAGFRASVIAAGRADALPVNVESRSLLEVSFDEFMSGPPVEEVNWSQSTLPTDERIFRLVSDPIDIFLTAEQFDLMPQAGSFDHLFYHLFSYFDYAGQRVLFAHPDEQEAAAFISRSLFYFDFDLYLQKYGVLEELAKQRSPLAQSRLYALLVWMGYTACVGAVIPSVIQPKGVAQEVLKEGRALARGYLGQLADSVPYAKNDLQAAMGFRLRRAAEAICFRVLEYGFEGRSAAAEEVPPPTPAVVQIFSGVGTFIETVERMNMGDTFENVAGSTIINRSVISNAFNRLDTDGNSETAQALLVLAEFVNRSGDPAAVLLFDQFAGELDTPDKDAGRLRSLWSGLVKVLPGIATLGDSVAKIASHF